MTSTNIKLSIEGRASSRVLKPPGGAHTDIFGSTRGGEGAGSRFSKQSQKSSISECFTYSNSNSNSTVVKKQDVVQELIKENNETANIEVSQNGVKNGSAAEEENIKPIANVPTVPPVTQRVRVPPGGFSSGLW